MKSYFLLFLALPSLLFSQADQAEDETAIIAMLTAQKEAWNNYDIEGFMEGYWKSPELKFYGAGGVVKGWQAILERYKKSYPTQAHFGTLDFVFNDISKIADGAYSVMGEFYLTRDMGDANGIFMLIVKKFDDGWKVIADTSASTPKKAP